MISISPKFQNLWPHSWKYSFSSCSLKDVDQLQKSRWLSITLWSVEQSSTKILNFKLLILLDNYLRGKNVSKWTLTFSTSVEGHDHFDDECISSGNFFDLIDFGPKQKQNIAYFYA